MSANAVNYVTQFTYDATGGMRTVRTYDTDSDPSNCGAVGARCSGVSNAPGVCSAGHCGVFGASGAFVDPMTDTANCGAVGFACPDAPPNGYTTCSSGTCSFACADGLIKTASACVDVLRDPFHCGSLTNVCSGAYEGTATCTAGLCGSDEFPRPVIYAVNGLAPGQESYRIPQWMPIVLTGGGLEKVTRITYETWGDDTVPAGVDANGDPLPSHPSIPGFAGGEGPIDGHLWSLQGPTTIVISADLYESAPPFCCTTWFKLRLYYTDPVTGDAQSSVLADVALSEDWRGSVALPPPSIDSVSVVRYIDSLSPYDSASGCIATVKDPTAMRPVPTMLLGADGSEYPILRLSQGEVCIPTALKEATLRWGLRASEFAVYALEWTDTNSRDDVIGLGSPGGGAILKGSNLVCDDGLLLLIARDGTTAPGNVHARCLGDRLFVTGVDSATEEWAYVELDTSRGAAVTPWPLRWRGPPVITGVSPSAYVTYGSVMTITGRWFVDASVTFADRTASYVEPLQDSQGNPPAVEQFQVIDDKHIAVLLSPQGGPVPRGLEQWCDPCGGLQGETAPGGRYFYVWNPENPSPFDAAWIGVSAVDPSKPYASRTCPNQGASACQAVAAQASGGTGSGGQVTIVTNQTYDSIDPMGTDNMQGSDDLSSRSVRP